MSVALFAFAPTSVQAQNCDPCDWDIEVGVEFLWWKPCVEFLWWKPYVDNLEHAAERNKIASTPVDAKLKYKNICPDWEPGVRVTLGAPKFYCDFGLLASYTYLNSCESDSVKNNEDILNPIAHTGLPPGSSDSKGKGSWDANFHEWDVLLSYDASCNSCHQLERFFDIAGIVLDQDFKATLDDDDYLVKWDSDFWGVGFRAGSEYQYRFSDCLRLYARGHGTILAGEADSKIKFEANEGSKPSKLGMTSFKDDNCCQIVPGYHLARVYKLFTDIVANIKVLIIYN